jgi:hypothetical protein
MKSLKFAIVLLLIATACEEKIDLPIASEDTGLLVVEGVLTNENRMHLVTLSLPYAKQNLEPQPATGASIWVSEDTTVYGLAESATDPGKYYTPVMRAVTGKNYTLHIQYQGKDFFATDSPVPVQPLQELKYQDSDDGYLLTFNPEGQDPYYIEHAIDWRNTDACVSGGSCEKKIVVYDMKTVDVNDIFKPNKEPYFFPRGATIIRRKYSVSPAYRMFLRSMLSETEWRGGLFDIQRADVSTNLSAGAVGFFATCAVVEDSTLVE